MRGLDLFRDHFAGYTDRYVLIGGAACDLIMTEVGEQFRATRDLDIVLCIEALDPDFVRALWEFIATGGYRSQEAATGRKRFYRFQKPANADYPSMLELFSRAPDLLPVSEGSHLTPIPTDDEASSLSAILLDDNYYRWILAGRRAIGGVTVVGPEHLVVLKAKAWLDLKTLKAAGKAIDHKSITKHKNDAFRLFPVLDPRRPISLSPSLAEDLRSFLEQVEKEQLDLNTLGLRGITLEEVIDRLRKLYRIG